MNWGVILTGIGAIFTGLGLIISQFRHAKRDAKWQGKIEQALRDKLGVHLNGD